MDPTSATQTIDSDGSLGSDFDPLAPGTVLAGRYEVRELLGRGGYAAVYCAFDRALRCEIALKVLRRDRTSPAALSRLRREVSVARSATSPHLVRVFDLATDGDTTFLTMELVRGQSLRARIDAQCLQPAEAMAIVTQVLTGLGALHELRIVHRDLKPENILIDETGMVKIADFGLAYFLDREQSRVTVTGAVVGTTNYLSPEQVLGREADVRSDLYAVGVILFEMLARRQPFEADSRVGSMLARVQRPAPPIRGIVRRVPLWLASIVARLLQRKPERRFATVAEVQSALRRRRVDVRAFFSWKIILAAAGALAVAAVLLWPHGVKFARLERSDHGVTAVDGNGNVLWRRDDIAPDIADEYTLARLTRGGRPLIASVLWSSTDYSQTTIEKLSFLDADTGKLVRQARVPLDVASFPHDPKKFTPYKIAATDLDGDGIDEIIISYVHVPEAPSFTVLYEPKLDRGRVLFSGTGGHQFAGVHDVDGDGRPEVLMVGINNAFDWINVAAAIRIDPWIGESNHELIQAESPDLAKTSLFEKNVVWYTLLPRYRALSLPSDLIASDDKARKITLMLPDRKVEIGMDGFLLSDVSPMPAAQRNALRKTAYASYRESNRLRAIGDADGAIAEISKASAIAKRINEPILLEVMERARGALLIRAGHVDEGESVMRAVRERSENLSEVAYDAAVACHLHGDLGRAINWYELGMQKGAAVVAGKSKHEFVQGLILALAEQRRWKEADDAIDRFAAAYPDYANYAPIYHNFIRWRRGETPDVSDIRLGWNTTDVTRYWLLEFRLARGEAPGDLLKSAEAEISINAQPQCVWRALRAELLARLGRRDEAAAEARAAWTIAGSERTTSIIARGHLPVVQERFERLAGGKS